MATWANWSPANDRTWAIQSQRNSRTANTSPYEALFSSCRVALAPVLAHPQHFLPVYQRCVISQVHTVFDHMAPRKGYGLVGAPIV
jgi:hypothetical protein